MTQDKKGASAMKLHSLELGMLLQRRMAHEATEMRQVMMERDRANPLERIHPARRCLPRDGDRSRVKRLRFQS